MKKYIHILYKISYNLINWIKFQENTRRRFKFLKEGSKIFDQLKNINKVLKEVSNRHLCSVNNIIEFLFMVSCVFCHLFGFNVFLLDFHQPNCVFFQQNNA